MKRNPRLYLDDILNAILKIEKYSKDLSFDELSEDIKTVDAIIRNFEIIGEAAKNVPEEIKRKHPQIPWEIMVGMRNKLIHEYFGVNIDVLWKTIKEDLPKIKPLIRKILKK